MAEQSKTLSEPETDTEEYTEEEQRQAEEAETENEEELGFFENIANNIEHTWNDFVDGLSSEDTDKEDEKSSNTEENEPTEETVNYDSLSDEEKLTYNYVTSSAEEQKDYIYNNVKTDVQNTYGMEDTEFLEAVESGYRTDENGEKQLFLGYKTIQTGANTTTGIEETLPKDESTVQVEDLNCTLSARTEVKPDNNLHNVSEELRTSGTFSEHTIVSYSGELGEFEYDTQEWQLATKEIEDAAGNKSSVQILKYVGHVGDGNNIEIPDGLKSLDYSFEGTEITSVPSLYNSTDEDGNPCSTIESAHCAFLNCKNLEGFSTESKEGNFLLYGGSATMPDSLMDASGMFYGCSSLRETMSVAGESCIDARSMYAYTDLCPSSGEDNVYSLAEALSSIVTVVANVFHEDWEYNPEERSAVMDTGNSLLSSISQFGTYTGTEVVNVADMSVGGRVDEETGEIKDIEGTTEEKEGLTKDETEEIYQHEAEANAKESAENADKDGSQLGDVNDAYVLTKGQAEFEYENEENERVKTGDAEEYLENTEDQTGWGIMNLIDFAGACVTEYGISSFVLGFVTDSKLLKVAGSIGIVAVGQITEFLPSGISDILSWVGEKVETVSPELGETITSIADALGSGKEIDSTSNDQRENLRTKLDNAEVDKPYRDELGRDQTKASFSDTIETELFDDSLGLGILTNRGEEYVGSKETIVNQMTRNGEWFVKEGAVYSVTNALQQDYSTFCDDQNTQATDNTKEMTKKYAKWAASSTQDEDGSTLSSSQMSSKQKEAAFTEFDTLYAGFEAYANGVLDTLQEQDNLSDAEMEQYENAVGQILHSAMSPYVEMIQEMDKKYDIMTDEQREQLESYNIPGISDVVSDTEDETSEQTETENEESVYETAGINDETSTAQNDDKNVETDVENNTEENDAVDGQTQDKGDIAENAFEEVMDAYETKQSEQPEYKTFDSSLSA